MSLRGIRAFRDVCQSLVKPEYFFRLPVQGLFVEPRLHQGAKYEPKTAAHDKDTDDLEDTHADHDIAGTLDVGQG